MTPGRYGGTNVDGVATAAVLHERPMAGCQVCPWQRFSDHGSQWLAIRAAARRHTRTTGHETHALVTYAHVYRAQADPELAP